MKTLTDTEFFHSKFPTNFLYYKNQPFEDSIKLYLKFGKIGYIHKDLLEERFNNKYKVVLAKASEEYNFKLNPKLIDKNDICSLTFNILYLSESKEECLNYISYINTNFFKFFLSLKKKTQDMNFNAFRFVPLLSFKEEWNDEKLYKLFNLTEEEIKYIEETIQC